MRCCASMRLDVHAIEEVSQNTWIEVANRIQSFAYDPKKSFRGWLWYLCRLQALKYLENKQKDPHFPMEERDEWVASHRISTYRAKDSEEEGVIADGVDPLDTLGNLYRDAEEIQARVRESVAPHTWEAFWLVSVCFWTPKEAARYLGISQAVAQKANQRVLRKLREEGRDIRGEMTTLE